MKALRLHCILKYGFHPHQFPLLQNFGSQNKKKKLKSNFNSQFSPETEFPSLVFWRIPLQCCTKLYILPSEWAVKWYQCTWVKHTPPQTVQ